MNVLTMHPSFAQCEASGVDSVTREDGVFTLHFPNGSKQSARLTNPNINDVMGIIAAVKAAQSEPELF
jgi:uncharacterized protein involved in tellurium resistance